jgi:8-amino-7-oxononanoate synthase
MTSFPEKLSRKLQQSQEEGNLRSLPKPTGLADFSSNDYLGFASCLDAKGYPESVTGSGGARLISGNHPIYEKREAQVATFHQAEAALIFNSG